MANVIRWATLCLCFSVLCACTTPDDRADSKQAPSQQKAHIFQEQTKTLEKAKNLSRTLQQTENARQQQFEGEAGKAQK